MHVHNSSFVVLSAILVFFATAFLRLLYILPASHRPVSTQRHRRKGSEDSIHLVVVLGSGGHTAEMLSMLSTPHFSPQRYNYRTYIVSEGDDFSARKAAEFEANLERRRSQALETRDWGYSIHTVPRARNIHQSLLSAPLSCVRCALASVSLLWNHPAGKPDLILVNGPATALIIVIAGLIVECFSFATNWNRRGKGGWRGRLSSVYVESWARVKTPSLSCKLIVILGLCDQVLVQWPQLEEAGWGIYKGVLVR